MDSRSCKKNKIVEIFLYIVVIVFIGAMSDVYAEDRIKLDSTAIKGSQELPKVLYIVPWKSARLDSISASAGSEIFDTEMEALDRDVFRRQVQYYGMLYGSQTDVR